MDSRLDNCCNAQINFPCAYYLLGADQNSPPRVVLVTVKGKSPHNWLHKSPLLLEDLNIKALKKMCHFLSCNLTDREANHLLMKQLQIELSSGSVSTGYFFLEPGAIYFPDGSLRFLRGMELIPDNCSRPYIVAPEISEAKLAGNGAPTACSASSVLLSLPPQALLTLGYVALTSVRSVVIDSGVDLQAVCYIVGGSGLGKTTLATRTAGIYRDQRNGRPVGIVQASSTISAVEDMLVTYRDQPVVVDDLCLSTGRETERKRRELGAKLIREGSGYSPIIKKKGKKGIKLFCNAGVLLTAEFPMEKLSDLNRCLIVPVDKQLHLPSTLTPDWVGGLIRCFSSWFAQKNMYAVAQLKADIGGHLHREQEPRVRTNYLCLRWAFRNLLESLVSAQLLLLEDCQELLNRWEEALELALGKHLALKNELLEKIPIGNLAAILYSGYKEDNFDLAKNLEKLAKHEGVIWHKDLCLRPEALVRFVRLQPGFHEWKRNRITQELKDTGALVLQEENASTVHLDKDSPRVYRIRLDVLKETAKYDYTRRNFYDM